MRITIDLDGTTLGAGGIVQSQKQEAESRPPLDDIDAGPPPVELLEMLAMEGALAPFMSAFQPLGDIKEGGSGFQPVRGEWSSGSLVKKRRG